MFKPYTVGQDFSVFKHLDKYQIPQERQKGKGRKVNSSLHIHINHFHLSWNISQNVWAIY